METAPLASAKRTHVHAFSEYLQRSNRELSREGLAWNIVCITVPNMRVLVRRAAVCFVTEDCIAVKSYVATGVGLVDATGITIGITQHG